MTTNEKTRALLVQTVWHIDLNLSLRIQ